MKLYKSDISKYFGELLGNRAVRNLTTLSNGEKLVVYYNIDEKNFPAALNIKTDKKYQINELIYREQGDFQHIAILSEPFDTQNYFLYLYLQQAGSDYAVENGINSKQMQDSIDEIFLSFKAQDLKDKKKLDKTPNVQFDIVNLSSLEKALRRFVIRPSIIEPLLNITELVSNSYNCVFDKPLLGGGLTKVVKATKLPSGMLMDENGGGMRYMIIGEKSNYKEVEGLDSLAIAKELKRAGLDDNDIYLETGWFLNTFDNKWRKKINDKEYYIKPDNIFDSEYGKLLAKEGYISDVISVMKNDKNVYQLLLNGYDLTLDDLVYHPTLFLYYPELRKLPTLYAIFDARVKEEYYYNSKDPKHIFIKGSEAMESKFTQNTILLHEIQHGVQRIEGFATGGNPNLALLINSVGGNNVREYFAQLDLLKKTFCNRVEENPELVSKKLIVFLNELINNYDLVAINRSIAEDIIKMSSIELVRHKCEDIIYMVLAIANSIDDIYKLFDLFQALDISSAKEILLKSVENSKARAAKVKGFVSKGWSANDINSLLFNYYLFLVGETESRYIQHASVLAKRLEDYFTPYTSEYVPKEYVTVFYDMPIEERELSVRGGLETYGDDKYVLHLFESVRGSEYLHELGHIVYDTCKEYFPDFELKTLEAFSGVSENDKTFLANAEEYFCHCFVNYILRKQLEPALSEANKSLSEADYSDFDYYISGVLSLEPNVDYSRLKEALRFIKELQILAL
jgi:hypothetical protein